MLMQKESLVDIAIARIKQHIVENEYKPGDRYLSEKELTENLQVSRTVIREALISLQSIGLLTIKRGGGIYINNQNFDAIKQILQHHYDTHGVKIKELIEIRQIIELGAIRLIIEKNTSVDLELLREINQAYHEAIVNDQDTRETDRNFHQQLMRATENETYYNFSEIINDYFSMTKINLIQNKDAMLKSVKEHDELIDRLQERDLTKAQDVMIRHMQPINAYINQLEGCQS
ncbi:FadR family transcriptional regulator [Virgibacillus sp. MSJ-26]|uniref:FadR/GntR family transcriptional regulator n=1 Tax=Virgibacillus sp. MSJ-26 TaxID=2841522 RepID=UPI001C1034F8|nr:FadR/GntR family transcriptional regulator [Virgibacillus sp. MSJ-26]MBU5468320.1 FadR family transcriptional regulator [Virgibacillus sp. MSJ-26]